MFDVICFSTHAFERQLLIEHSKSINLKIMCTDYRLELDTVHLAKTSKAVLCWASDDLSEVVLTKLKSYGCEMISLRSAGYSHLDLEAARMLNFTVTRVSCYSPESIAEHAVALYLSLNRKIVRAATRVKELDFRLNGLEGEQVFGKTIGVVGAGKIGKAFIKIMLGFGCKILIYDVLKDPELNQIEACSYTSLDELIVNSDVVSLHCPLTENTHHLINKNNIHLFKESAFLINTGRGGLIDTAQLINALKKKKIKGIGLDVYEFEENIFSKDFSDIGIDDDNLTRLLSFPNVLITSHQAFFTREAIDKIVKISLNNVLLYSKGMPIPEDNLLLKVGEL